jgi:hypothetical protein
MKKAAPALPAPAVPARPERWRIDAGDGDVATLMIPPDSFRTRHFEIDCRLVVMPLAAGAQLAMRVDVDGGLEWTRRASIATAGQPDSIDYHFRRELPAGQSLRVVVKTEAKQVRRVRLLIEAEEQG